MHVAWKTSRRTLKENQSSMNTSKPLRLIDSNDGEASSVDMLRMNQDKQPPLSPLDATFAVASSTKSFDKSVSPVPPPAAFTKGLGDTDGDGKTLHGSKITGRAAGEHNKKTCGPKSSYCDYSRVQVPSMVVASVPTNKQLKFPAKLHLVLSDPTYEDIIGWMPHGRSWKILKPQAFDEVLPHLFGHKHLNSFMRQVNGWGFRRIKTGMDYNSYYHELFLRGKPHLIDLMRRESVRAKDRRSKDRNADVTPTPDFYKMSEENCLPENPRCSARLATGPAVDSSSACSGRGYVEGIPGLSPWEVALLNASCHRQQGTAPLSFLAQQTRAMPTDVVTPHLSVLNNLSRLPYRSENPYNNLDVLGNPHLAERLLRAPPHWPQNTRT